MVSFGYKQSVEEGEEMLHNVQRSELETAITVDEIQLVTDDVAVLSLLPHSGTRLPPWEPGAHIDLVLHDTLVRQYSLCGAPGDRSRYRVAVLKEPESRGGSLAAHALKPGTQLNIRGPRNNFQFDPSPRYIFIAGGIGITPLLPMIAAAESRGAEWELYYVGRRRSTMAFRDELSAYGERVHIIARDSDAPLDLDALLGVPQPDTLVYCCGPERLLHGVEVACREWAPRSVRLERFVAKAIDTLHDTEFELVLERSGKTVTVPPGVSVFDSMRAAGVNVLGSCLEGICGTCEQTVLDGEVDHRDSVLDADEQEAGDCMMVCVSRCRSSRLVLDA